MNARPGWLEQRERGSALLMDAIMRIALTLGRPAAALLLYPVCAYFLLFSLPARRASHAYLTRVLGRRPRWSELFRHYHCFAATILDRVFLHVGRLRGFRFEWVGLDLLEALAASGQGFLLLGAHFGSVDALRALALSQCPLPVRVLMHAGHAAKMERVLGVLSDEFSRQVIALGRPQTMLEVQAALADGEIVALLADRALRGDRQIDCDFLGGRAAFPRGPFELAALLGVPIVLFCATYRERRGCYEIRFEALDEHVSEPLQESIVDDRCRAFAVWLETRCRAAPYNWFNFYDFWGSGESAGAR